jgi:helicase
MVPALERLLNRMIADGLIKQDGDNLRLTILGRACGESPLTLESAMRLVELLQRVDPVKVTLESLLVLIECLPERDEDYTPQNRKGESRWHQEALTRFGLSISHALQHRAESDVIIYARCKRALIVNDWIAGEPIVDIEKQYSANFFSKVRHGDIRGYADGSRFLLESALRIATILLKLPDDEEATSLLLRLSLSPPSIFLCHGGKSLLCIVQVIWAERQSAL